jgi:copper chaperone
MVASPTKAQFRSDTVDDVSDSQPTVRTKYVVAGMTCAHCAKAVTDELTMLPGVLEVTVEVEAGVVMVTTDRAVQFDDIQAAVSEAGYELVS